MSDKPFQRSSLVVWIRIAVLMSLPITLMLVAGESVVSSRDWNVSKYAILFYGGILLLVFAYLCSLPIIQLMTKYTDNGIEQPSVFGSKFLYWHEVREVRNIATANIVLIGSETKININPILFVNTQRFLAEIRARIPETVFPSDTQTSQEIIRGKRNDSKRAAISAYFVSILVFVIGTNVTATPIIGLLSLIYALVETLRWIRYGRNQP